MDCTPRKFLRLADILLGKGYSVGQEIGEGTYSKVRTCERIADGKMCAVKIIDCNKVRSDYLQTFMPRELNILAKLDHPNVVKMLAIIKSKELIFHVMEYAENGDVMHVIHREGHLPEDTCRKVFLDVLYGVRYLHAMKIAHRDIKCENILIFKDSHAAISDFGFVCQFDESENAKCRTFCGSKAYAAPEVLKGIPYDPRCSDTWSLGVVLFTMLSGALPFADDNATLMVEKQTTKDYSFPTSLQITISSSAHNLVAAILEPNVVMRPGVKDIIESEWLK